MTAATPCRLPSPSATTGIPPPPTVTTTTPAAIRALMAGSSTMRRGCGRRHDAPKTPVGVVDDVPSLLAASFRLLLVHEPADRLGRVLESRVVGGHFCLADDRRRLPGHAEPAELVAEVLLQRIADRALAVRPADVQRDLVHLVGRKLGAAQDEAHLRAVAVADGHVPALLDHGDDVPACLLGGDVLVRHASGAACP